MRRQAWLIGIFAPALVAGCIPVTHDRLRAGDLAERIPAFSSLPPELGIGYSPVFGARRLMSAGQLTRLAMKHGLISGKPESSEKFEDICFEWATAPLERTAVLAALQRMAAGGEPRVELFDYCRTPVPEGRLEFNSGTLARRVPSLRADGASAGVASLWRGAVRTALGRSIPVWARARVTVRRARLVAAENLPPHRVIESGHVRLEEIEEPPFGAAPLDDPKQAIGRQPKRIIRAGQRLLAEMLTSAKEIERGDQVAVEAVVGAARLRFLGNAESGGRSGDLILIRNPENGRRFRAVITGRGKASPTVSGNQNGVRP